MKEIMELMQRQKDEPDNPAVQLDLAERFLMMGAFDRALIFLEKAEKLDPGNPRVLNDKGIALYNTGRTEDAKGASRPSRPKTPDDYRASSIWALSTGMPLETRPRPPSTSRPSWTRRRPTNAPGNRPVWNSRKWFGREKPGQ